MNWKVAKNRIKSASTLEDLISERKKKTEEIEVISNKISWRNKLLARLDEMSTNGFTVTEVAQELGMTYSQVASFASRYDISFSKRKSRLAKKQFISEINKT
ncbi:hypothetical protein [Aliivibrio fischeri]|uniref:hypothetical protein n=1 Tax=Aliivibrio fischeri TaxID=668 RepID=UPI0009082179|nr:hypothetical protein [Aliivibrio fischeri]